MGIMTFKFASPCRLLSRYKTSVTLNSSLPTAHTQARNDVRWWTVPTRSPNCPYGQNKTCGQVTIRVLSYYDSIIIIAMDGMHNRPRWQLIARVSSLSHATNLSNRVDHASMGFGLKVKVSGMSCYVRASGSVTHLLHSTIGRNRPRHGPFRHFLCIVLIWQFNY